MDVNSEATQPSSVSESGSSPSAGQTPGAAAAPASGQSQQLETVSKADMERVLNDMHKYKKELLKLKEEKDSEKTARMKEQNQWKELAEAKEREAAEAREKSERLQMSYLSEKKYGALKSSCSALGLRPEALSDLEMLDLSEVQIETTSTGKINVLGAEKFAERLKATKPHWFLDKQTPTVNGAGPRVQDNMGAITPAMLLKAQADGQKAGDLSKYNSMAQTYLQQRRASAR